MVSLVDGVLNHLGKPGGFHVLVTVLLCCNFFPIALHHLTVPFYGAPTPHNCRLPEGWPWHKQFSIPKITANGITKYDQCHMFVDPNSAKLGTKPCVYGWEFYPQGREWTIVAEWGLVCERDYLVDLATVVYHGGVMFGGLVFGTLADKFGRKPLMLFTLYFQTAISIGIYFVQNFILYVILRFVHGLLLQGLNCTTFCLVMELLPVRYRTAGGMCCSMVWALAMVTLSLVAYSVQHWRYIQLAISLPCIVTFVYVWLVPESLRWLLTVTKTENAISAAQKFARFNKRPLGENFSKDLEVATERLSASTGQVESYGIKELLLQGSKLRISSLVLCFCWFATSCLYNGLTIRLLEVGSSLYISTIIIGVVDLVAFVVMYFLLVRFGRKRSICALLVLSGAVCISTVVAENLERGDSIEVFIVSTVLAFIERSCAAASLAGLGICAAEIFPTVVRTFGIGVCVFCAQVGWIIAPQILKLGAITMKSVPWIIFGTLAFLAGFLVLLLPETLSKPLPDSLDDVENLDSRKPSATSKPGGGGNAGDEESASPQTVTGATDGLSSGDGGSEDAAKNEVPVVTPPDKKWYQRNYSRKSAKVVRFYGLDGHDPCQDPCQEVKPGKKDKSQSIRMVRFSFESEEYRMDPKSPLGVRRFSVIREEPELETGLDDGGAAQRLDDLAEEEEETAATTVDSAPVVDGAPVVTDVAARQTFVATNHAPSNGERRSRFIVLRVVEKDELDADEKKSELIKTGSIDGSNKVDNCALLLPPPPTPSTMPPLVVTQRKSRFVVLQVTEEEQAKIKSADSKSLTNGHHHEVRMDENVNSSPLIIPPAVTAPQLLTAGERRSRFAVFRVADDTLNRDVGGGELNGSVDANTFNNNNNYTNNNNNNIANNRDESNGGGVLVGTEQCHLYVAASANKTDGGGVIIVGSGSKEDLENWQNAQFCKFNANGATDDVTDNNHDASSWSSVLSSNGQSALVTSGTKSCCQTNSSDAECILVEENGHDIELNVSTA